MIDHFVAWKLTNEYGWVTLIGTYHSYCEFDLEQLPNGWSGERNVDDVQESMEDKEEWKQEGYQFSYQCYEVDEDLNIKKCDKW